MSFLDIKVRLSQCCDIVDETPRLNDLLHNAEFVANKMKQVLYVFGEVSLGLTLNALSSVLQGDKSIISIIKEECGEDLPSDDKVFPFLMLYCSIVVFTEYIKIQTRQT